MATGHVRHDRSYGEGRQVTGTDDCEPYGDGAQIAELVLRARIGDRSAVGEIVERCGPMLRALARRHLSDPAAIDDVVQDVWVTFIEHIDRIHTPAATRGWLARVVAHTAWRAQGNAGRVTAMADLADRAAQDDPEETAVIGIWRDDLRKALAPALQALRPEDRRLVVLLAVDDRPDYRRVSRMVNRPVGSIGPTRQRALERLRRQPSLSACSRAMG